MHKEFASPDQAKETSSKRWQKPLTGQRHHLRIKQAMDGLRTLHDLMGLFLEPEATPRTDDRVLWVKEEILPKGPFYLHWTELHDWYFFLVPFSNNFKLDDLFFLAHLRAVYRVMYRTFLVHLSAKLEISLYKWTLNALVTLLKLPFINESFHQLVSLDGTTCTSENSSKLSLSGAQIWECSRGSSGQWRQ